MPRSTNEDFALNESKRKEIQSTLDRWRAHLENHAATARGTAPSIHDTLDFEVEQPDLGYLCEHVATCLGNIASKLVVALVLQERAHGLSVAIEAQRQELRTTQAIIYAMTHFLRTTPELEAPHLLIVFLGLAEACKSALTDLDPAALGLPIPLPFSN